MNKNIICDYISPFYRDGWVGVGPLLDGLAIYADALINLMTIIDSCNEEGKRNGKSTVLMSIVRRPSKLSSKVRFNREPAELRQPLQKTFHRRK